MRTAAFIVLTVLVLLVAAYAAVSAEDQWSVSKVTHEVSKALGRQWQVIKADRSPSVTVGGRSGYRTVFRQDVRGLDILEQQLRPVQDSEPPQVKHLGYSYFDLLVFPSGEPLSKDSFYLPIWPQRDRVYYARSVYMGTGKGYQWFANATIYDQEIIRDKLGLTGGDDRVKHLIDGLNILHIEGPNPGIEIGPHTPSKVCDLLAKHGDKAIPAIVKAIDKKDYYSRQYPFGVLGLIRTQTSTETLRRYYQSDDSELKSGAVTGLLCPPLREEAKDLYFDILRGDIETERAIEACAKMGWKDAVPILVEVQEDPPYWERFAAAFEAERVLEGRPGPKDLENARKTIERSDDKTDADKLDVAVAEILTFSDKESAAVVAVHICLCPTKRDTGAARQIGLRILRELPGNDIHRIFGVLRRLSGRIWNEKIDRLMEEL